MTKKPTLTSITSGFASNTQLNDNFEKLRTAFDNTLSLDGSTPNAMNADLDLNGNNINNVDTLDVLTELTLNGQVVTSVLTVPDWKGEWVTARAYVLNDLVRYNGATYIVKVAHTSGTFSVDQAAGKLEVFAEKGSSGAGTGDMLTTNNLSDLTNKPQALVNLGINATAAELNYVDGVTSNVQTQLDSKATLASPALTGTPTAPTASAGTNTTQVATTAFVETAVMTKSGVPTAMINDKLASPTQVQLSASTWNTVFLTNTSIDGGYTLASNRVTLPAGTYYTEFCIPLSCQKADSIDAAVVRLRNITAGSTAVLGQSARIGDWQVVNMLGAGTFTLASSSNLELQAWVNETSTYQRAFVNGSDSSGEEQIFSMLKLWKIA